MGWETKVEKERVRETKETQRNIEGGRQTERPAERQRENEREWEGEKLYIYIYIFPVL